MRNILSTTISIFMSYQLLSGTLNGSFFYGGVFMSHVSYNRCVIGGIVVENPRFTAAGDAVVIKLSINRIDIGKTEEIEVFTNEMKIGQRFFKEVHVGDYFLSTDAEIKTSNYLKNLEIICPECHEINYVDVPGEKTEIFVNKTFNCFPVSKEKGTIPSGINKVFLMGQICSKINHRQLYNDNEYVKYKLKIADFASDDVNFPFIVSFGKEAANATKHLKQYDNLFIEGAVQERHFKQAKDCQCPHCHHSFSHSVPAYAREIISSNVKYLSLKSGEAFKEDNSDTLIIQE